MVDLLLHGLYVRVLDAQAIVLLVLLGFRRLEIGRRRGGPGGARPREAVDRRFATLALALGVLALAAGVRFSLPCDPQVYHDEFWYLATARHMAATGDASPLVPSGLEGRPAPDEGFRPPYPQGWPWLLSRGLPLVPGGDPPYPRAVTLERMIGVLAPLAAFGMLCGESLAAATFAAGALALLPALVRLSLGAPPEGASLLFVIAFLWAARSHRRRPGPAGALLVIAAGAWAGHFRPENLLYLPLFLAVAFGPRSARMPGEAAASGEARAPGDAVPPAQAPSPAWERRLREHPLLVYGTLAALLALASLPDLVIMAAGARGGRSAEHFTSIPRPGFATVAENTWANLRSNASFLVDGRVLPAWVTPLALLGTLLLLRRGSRAPVLFCWGWVALFTLALSPFPFGDFASAYSLDTWRFSLQVSLPLLLLGARGLEWAVRDLPASLRPVLVVGIAATMLLSFRGQGEAFVHRPHPLQPLWRTLADVKAHLPGDARVLVDDPSLAVTLREGLAVDAVVGPVDAQAPLRGTPPRPLFLMDTTGDLPPEWSRFPLRVEWISSPPPSMPPPGSPPPVRIVVYACQAPGR